MFGKLLLKSLLHQFKQMLVIVFTVMLSTTLSTTILNIMYCKENHIFQNAASIPTYGPKIQLMLYIITIASLVATILLIYSIASICIFLKTEEFAVLRATGAYCFELQWLFLTQITVPCFIGGLFGYLIGSIVTKSFSIKYFDSLLINTKTIIPILIVLMLTVMLIGILPSLHRIKKLDPAKVF